MRLNIISSDFELINKLKEINILNVKSISEDELSDNNADVLVISNKIISFNKLLSLKNNDAVCFYMSSNDDSDFIQKIDSSIFELKKIHIIPPKRTVSQIQELILDKLFKTNNKNNVFTFFGTDSKVGTTSIAQSTALNLSKRHKNKSVIMLFLDGQTGFDWVDSSSNKNCLSDIKIALKNNFLTVSNLKESCYQYSPNFFMLKGEISLEENVYYHQNDINSLINLCKDNFDFVIIDAGNTMNLSLRMTYSALINSDNRILVSDQMPKSYEMFAKGRNQVLEYLKISDFKLLVLNKYIQNGMLPKKDELADKYQIPIIGALPYLEFYYQAAIEKNISAFETEKAYKNTILTIAEYVEKKCGLEINELNKRRFLSFIRR